MAAPRSYENTNDNIDVRERLVRIEEQLNNLRLSVDRIYRVLGWIGMVVGGVIITSILQLIIRNPTVLGGH